MLSAAKQYLKRVPVLGQVLVRLRGKPFISSSVFWEDRYLDGGHSGAGSYGRLAEFKATFLNSFVAANDIASVIEFGSGDGAQLRLARYPRYTGVDISPTSIKLCRASFSDDQSKTFFTVDELPPGSTADLALSLDVIYHLVEDEVFESYMSQLFDSARRFVIVYASNEDKGWPNKHVLHREFTKWISSRRPGWVLQSVTKNQYPYDASDPEQTSFSDFYVFTAT